MSPRVRVLVVDDSAFARKVIREVLNCGEIDVVGTARDGLEALEKIAELKPDVITLDLMMPNLDGLGVLRALSEVEAPRVLVVSMSGAESALGIEALHAGAIDVVQKPTALATERLYEMGAELRDKVVGAAHARTPKRFPDALPSPPVAPLAIAPGPPGTIDLVVLGTSTGGPQALTRLLGALPADFPAAIAIALHIPEGYTKGLAQRLDTGSQLRVHEAVDGMKLRPGFAVLAPGGKHLRIGRGEDGLLARVSDAREDATHMPSVDFLFESAAEHAQGRVVAVVLTGMGNDGLAGARRLKQGGATILTEGEASCVVYGMPRSVREAGLATAEAPLDELPALLLRSLR